MRLRLRIVVKQGDAEKGRVLVEDARCLVEEAENRRRNEEVVFEDQKMAVTESLNSKIVTSFGIADCMNYMMR